MEWIGSLQKEASEKVEWKNKLVKKILKVKKKEDTNFPPTFESLFIAFISSFLIKVQAVS